jgi:hypothetical protein
MGFHFNVNLYKKDVLAVTIIQGREETQNMVQSMALQRGSIGSC